MDLKILLLFLPIISASSICGSGSDWFDYKDEKCIKLVDQFTTKEAASEICKDLKVNGDANPPSLIIIRTEEEQEFINDMLYKNHSVIDGVWIAGRRNEESHDFLWDNDETMEHFSNWAQDSPSNNPGRNWVRMITSLTGRNLSLNLNPNGKWTDVACGSRNLILCEKLPSVSFEELQRELLKIRHELNLFKEETENYHRINEEKHFEYENYHKFNDEKHTEYENALTNIDDKFRGVDSEFGKIDNSLKQIIPSGFIYCQIGTQPSPQTIWPQFTWTDVSSSYAGLFFRVTGGGAAGIGTTQAENAPRIDHMSYTDNGWHAHDSGYLNVGSTFVFTGGYHIGKHNYKEGLSIRTSGGEVRPKNTAMRVWKRV